MLSQEALKIMSEKDQEKLQREGNKFLLTAEALRKLDILTGALQLREFACENCDHVWWKTVPFTKLVSKCNKCRVKYDALPRDKEFGIGRYQCTQCKHSFFLRCEATSEQSCFNCKSTIKTPYIHPKFRPLPPPTEPTTLKPTIVINQPQLSTKMFISSASFQPVLTTSSTTGTSAKPRPQPPRQRRVIHASTVHDSTGSTASTFITQIELPGYSGKSQPMRMPDSDSDEEDIIESDEEVYESSSGIGSDSEQTSDVEYISELALDPSITRLTYAHSVAKESNRRETKSSIEKQSIYSPGKH